MLKQKQRWLHLEDGDCYRTCIAGYLGMVRDSVPHFVELHGGEDWNDSEAVSRAIEVWMKDRGLVMISVNGKGGEHAARLPPARGHLRSFVA